MDDSLSVSRLANGHGKVHRYVIELLGYTLARVMTTCSEGDVITLEHTYLDILNTDVMGFIYEVKPVIHNS